MLSVWRGPRLVLFSSVCHSTHYFDFLHLNNNFIYYCQRQSNIDTWWYLRTTDQDIFSSVCYMGAQQRPDYSWQVWGLRPEDESDPQTPPYTWPVTWQLLQLLSDITWPRIDSSGEIQIILKPVGPSTLTRSLMIWVLLGKELEVIFA